ncbi:MAG: hypothetical protein IJS89_00070 [Bacteroidaceae bacterium]|nr:hypothetical protein [Bacteroidaceae bacterium]
MKKFSTLFACLMAFFAIGMQAATYTYEVGYQTGTFYRRGAVCNTPPSAGSTSSAAGSIWADTWKSTTYTSQPELQIECTTGRSFDSSQNGMTAGSSGASYTISAPEGYVVSSYVVTGTSPNANLTFTPEGRTAVVFSQGVANTATVEEVYTQTATFSVTGSNNPIRWTSFTVTIIPEDEVPTPATTATVTYNITEQNGSVSVYNIDYEVGTVISELPFSVKQAGSGYSAITPITVTEEGPNVINATFTGWDLPFVPSTEGNETWYILKLGSNRYANANNPSNSYAARDLTYRYAFVGNPVDGFKLKNAGGQYLDATINSSTSGNGWSASTSMSSEGSLFYIYLNENEAGFRLWHESEMNAGRQMFLGKPVGGYTTISLWSSYYKVAEPDGLLNVIPVGLTDLSSLSNDKAYTLTTARGSLGINGDQIASTMTGGSVTNPAAAAGNFAIINYNGSYYLWSVEAGKFVVGTGQLSDMPTTAITFEGNAPFLAKLGDNCINIASGYPYGVIVNDQTTADEGNMYAIREAGAFDPTDALAALAAFYASSVTYVIQDENGNVLFTSEPQPAQTGTVISTTPADYIAAYTTITEGTPVTVALGDNTYTSTATFNFPFALSADYSTARWQYVTLNYKYVRADESYKQPSGQEDAGCYLTNSSNEKTDVYKWAFFGNPYTGIYMMNKAWGDGYYLHRGTMPVMTAEQPTDEGFTAAKWYIYENGDGFVLLNMEGENYWLNDHRNEGRLAYWINASARTGAGSTFRTSDAWDEAVATLQGFNIGTALGEYSFGGAYAAYTVEDINTLIAAGYTPANLDEAEALAAALELNLPQSGQFLRIKSVVTNAYISSTPDPDIQGEIGMEDYENRFTTNMPATDVSTIWYYDGTGLVSYATGFYANNIEAAAVGSHGTAITFSASGNTGLFRIKPEGQDYWYAGDTMLDNIESTATEHNNFTLESVTEVPVTITEAGQATFNLPVAWTVPASVTVRYATQAHDGLLTMEDTEAAAIAADEAVVLVATPGTYTVEVAASGTTLGSTLTPTALGGTAVPTSAKAYVLAKQGDKVGFALLNDTERDLAAFKAYYVLDTAGDAPQFLFFDEGDVTGINSVNAAAQNGAAVYDLQGRRVNGALKGVYIVNGKKVLF